MKPWTTWRRHATKMANGVLARHEFGPIDAHEEPDAADDAAADDDMGDVLADPDSGADHDSEDVGELFALEIAEQVATNRLNQTGADAVLGISAARWQRYMREEGPVMPRSWHRVQKAALEGRRLEWFSRDYCSVCDYRFPKRTDATTCPPRWGPAIR